MLCCYSCVDTRHVSAYSVFFFFLMIRRPPRSTLDRSSAASDVYKRQNLFWCFCPNANLFIEDRMPDIPMLMKHVQYITIGTDSLASNHGLSILEELISIQNKFPEIKTNDLLRWGTLYGAKFLGIDDRFGSFDKGKKPGVNLIKYLVNESLHNTVVEKIL